MRLRILALLLLALSMTACQPAEEEEDAPKVDAAKAAAVFAQYEAARNAQDWEIAEAKGDEYLQCCRGGEQEATLRASLFEVRTQAEQSREDRRLRELWDYQSVTLPAGVQHTAAIYSRTHDDPEAEVIATPDARLVLRLHPEWGRSSYLLLNQSAYVCNAPCKLRLRFDDGEWSEWAGKTADSGNGPALFINDDAAFIPAMRAAKKLRIELPTSGAVAPAFEFELAGFDAEQAAKVVE